MVEKIAFKKKHIRVAIDWQVQLIAELSESEELLPDEVISRLSAILAVLWRCYENAPD